MLTVDFNRFTLGPGMTVLDVGCGQGRHSFEALRRGADVTAFDFSRSDLDEVQTMFDAMAAEGQVPASGAYRTVQGDARAMPFDDASFERGTFRRRGDTIEIFPAHYEDRAWRVSLFGDEVESISEFDPLTGKKTADLDEVTVYAASHYVTPRPTLNQAVKSIKEELKGRLDELNRMGRYLEAQRLDQRCTFDIEMIEATGACNGPR